MKKKVLAMSLAVVLSCAQVMVVNADTIDEVQRQKEQTSSQLAGTEAQIDALESKKNQLTSEINELDAKLVKTIAYVNELKDSISEKEAEIENTKTKLAAAEADRDQQYSDMKRRIQYLYENGGNGAWATVLLEDGNISSMLSSVKQTQELYDYDQNALEDYISVVQQVADLAEQLETEKADLVSMEAEQEEEQKNLENILSEKKATSADYDNQIASAEQKAAQYQSLIEQQNTKIKELVAEQQRQQEEAARQQAAAEEAARQTTTRSNANSTAGTSSNSRGTSNENSGSRGSSSNSTPAQTNTGGSGNTSTGKTGGSGSKDQGSASTGSATGSAIVSYACNFIGNPYVWGGESLTNGADCSGFIKSVYAHFGYSLPRTSGALRSAGRGVSYAEAQPGDIICYEGHVAIYMGGGQIVHASNSAPYPQGGIKVSSNAAYRTILAVRRVI
ncbi:C40 family peptidase [Novisyntrophococcus fermenticellae]|uniref:C40 family peptidase n=1 Tax=Novisyntrophococcus fermenticellae TaxID=2068655 RepID=UPI001E4FD34F|nr:C40 family peptidase [Novisyntrophococcus fermenticellae]